jgi:hypothetical protein
MKESASTNASASDFEGKRIDGQSDNRNGAERNNFRGPQLRSWCRLATAALIVLFTKQVQLLVSFYEATISKRSVTIQAREFPDSSSGMHEAGGCSCRHAAAPPRCCQRVALRAHKMGTILMGDLLSGIPGVRKTVAVKPEVLPLSTAQDYRHVVMVRNVVEAMVRYVTSRQVPGLLQILLFSSASRLALRSRQFCRFDTVLHAKSMRLKWIPVSY